MTSIFHDVQQNTDDWDNLRLGLVTSSNNATIMAHNPKEFGEPAKRYALKLVLERITGRRAEYSFKNDYMEMGNALEPTARLLYEQETFCDVTNGGFFHCGDYGDSPDGLVGDDGVVEIKSVIASTHLATRRRGTWDSAYEWQLVGHLDCTGRDWVDYVSYCSDFPASDQLLVYRMHRSDVMTKLAVLRERRKAFIRDQLGAIYYELTGRIMA